MKSYADICLERAENAPLSSDDHEHDCMALREFCELELIYAYDVMVPELARRLKRAIAAIRSVGGLEGFPKYAAILKELEAPLQETERTEEVGK